MSRMALKILSVKSKEGILYHLNTMNSFLYESLHRELYCETEGCQARIAYVRAAKPYFRDWRGIQHESFCDYYKSRDEQKVTEIKGTTTSAVQYVPVTEKQAKSSVNRMFDKHSESISPLPSTTKARVTKIPKKVRGHEPQSQLTLFNIEGGLDESTIARRPKLFGRNVKDLSNNDINKVRTVGGYLEYVNLEEQYILLKQEGQIFHISLSEAFFSEPINSVYIKALPFLKNYAEEKESPYFVAVVEVIEKTTPSTYRAIVTINHQMSVDRMPIYHLIN